jgi:hypothetical protein
MPSDVAACGKEEEEGNRKGAEGKKMTRVACREL